MPLYDVECSECQIIEEVLVRGADVPSCPKCGSTKVVKLPPASNFKLIGSGWAKDLYASPVAAPQPTTKPPTI